MVLEELEMIEPNKWEKIKKINEDEYMCNCSCGNIVILSGDDLRYNKTRSCELCMKKDNSERQRNKYEGHRFGAWLVKHYLGKRRYNCLCTSCNREYSIDIFDLLRGHSHSCKECAGFKLIDLTDKIFGNYKALYYEGNHYWKCKCLKCGKETSVTSQHLRLNNSIQCKECSLKEMATIRRQEMLDRWKHKKFGTLTPITYDKNIDSWLCKCDCGNSKWIQRSNLVVGHSKSCGCKMGQYKNSTMIERYGDISSKRIKNPRESYKMDILYSKEKMRDLVNKLKEEIGRLPTSNELAEILDVQYTIILKYTSEYGIDIYKGNFSNMENEFIKLFPEVSIHRRNILSQNKEIDLYFDKAKLAIEINGVYWHSDLIKPVDYHRNKTIECRDKGIRLIHIYEDEWNNDNKKNQLIKLITNILSNTDNKNNITDIREIDTEDYNNFSKKYSLIHDNLINKYLGYYESNQLIGIVGCYLYNDTLYINEVADKNMNENNYSVVLNKIIDMYNNYKIVIQLDSDKFSDIILNNIDYNVVLSLEKDYYWIKPNLIDYISYIDSLDIDEDIIRDNGYLKVYKSGKLVTTLRKGV